MGHKVGKERIGVGGLPEQKERIEQEGHVLKYQYFKWERNIHQFNLFLNLGLQLKVSQMDGKRTRTDDT